MKKYLSLIKFAHTVFALPFAMLGFFLGVHAESGEWSVKKFILVVLCMVFARSAAMAFNRLVDREIDARNERTAGREIPAGTVSPRAAGIFVGVNALLFVTCAYLINPICFYLSPVALLVILGYSWTKRFTFLCHFVLGLGLALAPVGAYLAVTGEFAVLPILYGLVVLLWVSGFDIIYALQDVDFDQSLSLHSVPAYFGRKAALAVSTILHAACAFILLYASQMIAGVYPQLNWLHWTGTVFFVLLLIYQHLIVKPNDLSRVNLAFFTANGVASVAFALLVIADFYL